VSCPGEPDRVTLPLLADVFALYLKTKNFHWHVSGPHFRDYHLMLDEQAEQIFAATDDIAERVRGLSPYAQRLPGSIVLTDEIKWRNAGKYKAIRHTPLVCRPTIFPLSAKAGASRNARNTMHKEGARHEPFSLVHLVERPHGRVRPQAYGPQAQASGDRRWPPVNIVPDQRR
jgi:hypothetical protein